MLEDEIMQESFRTSLYTYRSIPDDDLADYLYFLKSKECRSFINLMIESTGKAFDSYLGRYMQAVEDEVKEQKKNMPQKQQPQKEGKL